MKCIIGLGNPGKEYDHTRHNVGFRMVDAYAKQYQLTIDKEKMGALYAEFTKDGEKVLLVKPQSYMNLSGEVVRRFVDYFKIDLADLLIVHDDLDLSLGNFKLKETGSSGGHNGLKNIELHLATQDYKRLKIGISNDTSIDTKDYVLGKFRSEEEEVLNQLQPTIMMIFDKFLSVPFSSLMNQYNRKNG